MQEPSKISNARTTKLSETTDFLAYEIEKKLSLLQKLESESEMLDFVINTDQNKPKTHDLEEQILEINRKQ
jgi:hypothetical protein